MTPSAAAHTDSIKFSESLSAEGWREAAPLLLRQCDSALRDFGVGAELLRDSGVGSRDLLRQFVLHVYRFKNAELACAEMESECRRLAEKILRSRGELPYEFRSPAVPGVELRRTRLAEVDPQSALLIHSAYHYLGSFRGDGLHLGLYADSADEFGPRLCSVVTLSPFDLAHIADALPDGLSAEQVLVVSRVFAFDWCPRNTASYTLGRVFAWLRQRLPHVKLLLTYLNPNLGFRGTIYRATNWRLFGLEKKGRYLYLDSDYVTDRQMLRRFGTADFERLRLLLGDRIAASTASLRPLEVYAYPLDRRVAWGDAAAFANEFEPSSKLVGVAR